MDSHHRDLRRGFNWLGSAMAASKVIDFATILLVLGFLTKEQVGLASLVVAIGTVIEALDGLGTSAALVQARSLTREQLDSLFWYIAGGAVLVGALTLAAARPIAAFYGAAGMSAYFLAVAIKQPLVGAAVIPLALMSRDLEYERIAIVNICSTFAAAATRLGLAILGAGAWAIVIAYAASGLFTLLGALIAKPFRPGLRFRMAPISPLVHFGLRATTSSLCEQAFNNVDYLVVGWLYGAAPLAIYRVAFDVATQPAAAVGTLINRAALPVFARVAAARDQLAQSLTWSLERLLMVTCPLAVATLLAAAPIGALIHDERGHSYAAAALPLQLLAAAALLRVMSQLMYPLLLASGRPRTAAGLSVVTLLLLSGGFTIVGFTLPAGVGIVAIAAIWLALYPPLLLWDVRYLKRHWHIRARSLARALRVPLAAGGLLAATVELARIWIAADAPRMQIAVIVAAAALTYTGLYLHDRQRRYSAVTSQ
jgi:O-antigen/teichoic acid export membrane protein